MADLDKTAAQFAPLFILSTVPVAIGSYGPAVQLAGELSNQQAVLLQCGTYAIATTFMWGLRFANERKMKVHARTWLAGIELGLWIFMGATLQSFGLQRTTTARAGFLVQLSTVFVPIAECVLKQSWPAASTAASVFFALIGLAMLLSSPATATSRIASWNGDALVAFSAVFYSGHILRLSSVAKHHSNVELGQAKSLVQLSSSVATFAFMHLASPLSKMDYHLLPATAHWTVLYTGFVTCAYPMWAQAFGQARVKASQASLIYATAPVWNAMIAAYLLDQNLGRQALIGAGLMMVGFLLTVLAKKERED